MQTLKNFMTTIRDYIIGWIETLKQPDYDYQYVIDNIQLTMQNNTLSTLIRYKIVGCRTVLYEHASNLNHSHLFYLFRPDHAQMIVSIATIETFMHKSPNEIIERYKNYIQQCATQFKRE